MYQSQTKRKLDVNTATDIFRYADGVHYDSNVEAAILGVVLLEPHSFSRVATILEESLFFLPFNKIAFSAIKEMYGLGEYIDLITVTHFMRKKGITDFNGDNIAYLLSGLMNNVVSSAHLESHSLILREIYLEREMVKINNTKFDGTAIDKAHAIQKLISSALNIQGTDDWMDMSQLMLSLDKHRENVRGKDLLGVPTGIKSLDMITAGFQPTQLIVIAARPAIGKSAYIGGVAINAARKGYKVGVISLEMPTDQIASRYVSVYSDVEFYKIYRASTKTAQEEKDVMQSMGNIAQLPIYTTTKTSVTATAIRAKTEKLKMTHGIDLLIIDYLQLIESEGKNDNREREISKLSRSLKLMAMDLKIPVIVLCQLNRESEKNNSKPKMSQIRESGAIEQDADVVMLLHRDYKIGILQDENGNDTKYQANIIVEKNRNGETKDIPISFSPETMKFYEKEETFSSSNTKSFENVYSDGIRNAKPTDFNEEAPF